MGLYSYEVVDRIGRSGSGQMAADDEMLVAEKLRNMGLTVLDINEVRQSPFSTLFKRKPKVGIGPLHQATADTPGSRRSFDQGIVYLEQPGCQSGLRRSAR
jgi:hypothetical protein